MQIGSNSKSSRFGQSSFKSKFVPLRGSAFVFLMSSKVVRRLTGGERAWVATQELEGAGESGEDCVERPACSG